MSRFSFKVTTIASWKVLDYYCAILHDVKSIGLLEKPWKTLDYYCAFCYTKESL